MKKLAALLLLTGTIAVMSCGPSAEELRKKRVKDSTDSVVQKHKTEDSMINAMLTPMLNDTSNKKDTAKH